MKSLEEKNSLFETFIPTLRTLAVSEDEIFIALSTQKTPIYFTEGKTHLS